MENKFITDSELLSLAKAARADAYCPYSGISVGAALLTEDGKIYLGANIENAAFTPTVCAERVAFFKAYSAGERSFSAIAVAGGKACADADTEFPPCGVCRQVMAEFCDADFRIIMPSDEGATVRTLSELLPYGFGKDNI